MSLRVRVSGGLDVKRSGLRTDQRDFPVEHQPQVRDWLIAECGRTLPFCENADDAQLTHIRLAVLRLSNGDVEKFLYWLEVAKKDWRDVLIGN